MDLDVIPTIPNSKLQNSSISIAGHSTALGGSVSLNTGNISEHTDYKYYTDARARGAVSVSGDLAYNSSTGVISFTERTDAEVRGLFSARGSLSYNSTTGVMSFTMPAQNTSNITEGTNLYFTNARARSAISATGSLSYNSTTGVMSFTMPAQNTSNITEGTNLYYTNARADARIAAASTSDLSEGTNLYYTDARADARVALIVDSAPGTLNTLNELAAALGDDANFSTTVTNSIATKLPLAGGALTGAVTTNSTFDGRNVSVDGAKLDGIEAGATADQTAAQILTAIKTVDGSGSGLDADLLDGINSGSFLRSDASDTVGNGVTYTWASTNTEGLRFTNSSYAKSLYIGGWSGSNTAGISRIRNSNDNLHIDSGANGHIYLNNYSTGTTYIRGQTAWHAGNDGAGSGLDADLLDGQQGSYYTNASNLGSGTVPDARLSSNVHFVTTSASTPGNGNLSIGYDGSTYSYVQSHSSKPLRLNPAGNAVQIGSGNTAWHSGNDGSGSGLDADLLDGQQGSYYLPVSSTVNGYARAQGRVVTNVNDAAYRIPGMYGFNNVPTNGPGTNYSAMIVAANSDVGLQIVGGYTNNQLYFRGWHSSGGTYLGWNKVWHSTNDGSGSGLRCGFLDGYNTSTSATANTVVVREGSGHIYGNYILGSYFNASSGNSENPTIGQVWTQSTGDNYLRKSTPAHFKSQLGLWHTGNDGSVARD